MTGMEGGCHEKPEHRTSWNHRVCAGGMSYRDWRRQAQTMDQYFAVPPFVSDQVAPNIILVLDNSGSMSGLGCDRNDDGDCADAASWHF